MQLDLDDAKKKAERMALEAIYGEADFSSVLASESPDFLITHRGEEVSFGVEVTEFYFSESNARARNIPNYVLSILNGESHRHKGDIQTLKVGELKYRPKDSEEGIRIHGIVQEQQPVDEYARLIAAAIMERDEKLHNYKSNLKHINLIVVDMEQRLSLADREHISRFMLNDSMCQAILSSGFREIFLLTVIKEQQWVYVPLMLLFVLSDLYAFDQLLDQKDNVVCGSALDKLAIFAVHLSHNRKQDVMVRSDGQDFEILCRGYGIMVNEENRPNIRDYGDRDYNTDISHISSVSDPELIQSGFVQALDNFRRNHAFTCSLVFDAKSKPR
jgi:hypothetical protein